MSDPITNRSQPDRVDIPDRPTDPPTVRPSECRVANVRIELTKALRRKGGVSSAERWRLDPALHPHRLATVKGECVYCFQPATTYDHVIPRRRPGWDALGNVVPACLSCNGQKGQRTPVEWLAAAELRSQ